MPLRYIYVGICYKFVALPVAGTVTSIYVDHE